MKARLFMFMALVLGLVSCQNEPDEMNVLLGGEQEVMLTVSLPEATRADSADGALDNGVLEDYDLRYILEVYYGEKCNRFVQTSTSTSAVFPVRLAPGRTYTFVVWADFVTKGANAENDIDLFYDTDTPNKGLKEIQIIEEKWAPMVEARDAYVGSKTIADFQTSSNLEMTLTRPFAKVRVVSTDIEQLRGVGIVPTTAQATYSQPMYRKFNAVTGVASDASPKTHTFAYANVDSYEEITDSKLTIFSDYIFVPDEDDEGVAKFTLDVWDGETPARSIKQNNFNTDIFVVKNKVTSIVGDVLTTGGNVKVTIDGELGEKETITVVDNAQSLQDAINNAPDGEETTIELGGDIDLNDLFGISTLSTRAGEPAYVLLVDADKEVALDLKGFTISYEKTQTAAFSMIQNDGKLTIVDSSVAKTGKIVYADKGQGGNYVSNTIGNSGELIISGGTIENSSISAVAENGYPHPIDNNKKLTINDGTITNNADYSSLRIWCTTDDDTEVIINGGTLNGSIDFHNVNTAANKGVLTINGGTFNADNYTKSAVRLLGFGVDVDEMFGYIKGGTFNGEIKLRNYVSGEFNSKVFAITGGTFSDDPSEFVDSYYVAVERDGKWEVERRANVAKVGDVEYTFLSEAVNAATNGATITLLEDVELTETVVIPEGKTVVLDLNEKTISHKDVQSAYAINNRGTLTIKNGTVTSRGIYNGYDADGNHVTTAKLTVESGTYNAMGTNGGAAIFNYGTADIKGGNFESNGGYGLSAQEDAIFTISNANIRGGIYNVGAVTIDNSTVYQHLNGKHAIYNWKGTVTINSGEFDSMAGNELILADGENSSVTINDGTFDKTAKSWLMGAATGKNITFVINGGTFRGYVNMPEMTVDTFRPYGDPIVVKGGVFNFDPTNWLGEMCVAENNGNGTWSVAQCTPFSELVEKVKAANGTYVGQGETYTIMPTSGDAREQGVAATVPNRLQKYSNPEVYYAQYQLFAELSDVSISNVEIEFIPAAITVKDAWNTAGATTTIDKVNGEVQFMNSGKVTLTDCVFNTVSVSPINAPELAVSGCEFNELKAYAIKDVNASNVIISNNKFNNCNGGFWFNAAPENVVAKGNIFSVGRRGAIQFSATGDYTNSIIDITGNTVVGALLWQLNETLPYQAYKTIIENNTYTTACVDGSFIPEPDVAKIGEVGYTSLAKAVAAVKDGETITLVADEVFTENNYYDNGGYKDGLGYAGDKSFTLDLGGNTISQDGYLNDYLLWFKNVGSKDNTITIKNGTLDAGTTAYCALCTASANEHKITINTENITITNNNSNGSTVKVRGGAILNVKAGTKIIGKNSYLGIECAASTVNIYDGAEIYMNGTSSYNGCLAGACYGGTINVYGGYGKGVKGGFIAMTSGGTINVSGGEWIANTDGTIGDNSNLYVLTAQSNKNESGFVGGAYVNVTGGTLRGGMDAWVLNNIEGEVAELNISGGNFNSNPAHYVVAGYKVIVTAENNYEVVKEN